MILFLLPAWDAIEVNNNSINAVTNSDAFVFGSLACRNQTSYNTLLHLLDNSKFNVFDINLRAPYYSLTILETLLHKTNLLKLNDDELEYLAKKFGFANNTFEGRILSLKEKFNLNSICVTKGKEGAILLTNGKLVSHPGYRVKVADTVGAGDSFLAGLLYQILNGNDSEPTLQFACALGALAASKTGATSKIESTENSRLNIQKLNFT